MGESNSKSNERNEIGVSSKLKKKSKEKQKIEEYIGITKERTARYKREKKEDDAVRAVSENLSAMVYLALMDVLGYKEKRLLKYQGKTLGLKDKWVNDVVTTPEMLFYCEKKGIKIKEWLESIPKSQKLALSPVTITTKEGARIMEMAVQTHGLFCAIVLKEFFKATKKEIQEVLDHIKESIACCTTKQPTSKKPYLEAKDIEEIFRTELKLDLRTGKKIA